jgi:2-polyprenyl-6-methoxyphenol hydroxylase-like FAD-dependent oxidoreductase
VDDDRLEKRVNSLPQLQKRCVIAGGGPAGMMLGFLLARAGVDALVLEKHGDFLRDFRGDTIHPSTLELMHELGLLDEFLQRPHQEVSQLCGVVNGHSVPIADFSRLPTRCKFIAFMPQWDFLDFISEHARRFPSFELRMEHEVIDLVFEGDRVAGVRVKTSGGEMEMRADLVVGCDGRSSIVRDRAGFKPREYGAPIDVLWMRLSKHEHDPQQALGFFRHGKLLVLLDRDDYWQCGYVIPKGGFDAVKARGLSAFHDALVSMADFLRDRVGELDDWAKIKLLTVQINRLPDWCRDGLICIGDAAHAMSPAGGVGINLAIQDAVAAANLLAEKLRRGPVSIVDLRAVQERRAWPAAAIQWLQTFVHRYVVTGHERGNDASLPFLPRLLRDFPSLRRFPAWFDGIGPRPENIASPAK